MEIRTYKAEIRKAVQSGNSLFAHAILDMSRYDTQITDADREEIGEYRILQMARVIQNKNSLKKTSQGDTKE